MQLRLIQASRGVAALLVIIHHISNATKDYFKFELLNDIFSVGWSGVDFFFVLSGFIMIFIHYNDLRYKSNVDYFFVKRFVRIYPIYWVLASISLVFYLFSGKTEGWGFIYILKSYLLIYQDQQPFLAVAWSLTYEVFFYLVFGIGIFLGLKTMKIVLPLWFIAILAINIMHIGNLPQLIEFCFNGYIIDFLLGCATGYIFHFGKKLTPYRSYVLFSGLLLFIIMFFVSLTTSWGSRLALETRLMYGIACSFIILGAALIDATGNFKTPRLFLLLGDSSYILYLVHPLVLATIYKISFNKTVFGYLQTFNLGLLSIVIALVAFVASIGIGIGLHLTVETKLLNLLNPFLPSRKKNISKLSLA